MGYKKLPETKTWGFVVNAHSTLNLDIDIIFKNEQLIDQYKYSASKPYHFEGDDGFTYQSKAYRCRLRGLSLIPGKKTTSRKVLDKLQKKIHEQRDWVILKISDIDSYDRILVDIIDPISHKSLNDYIISSFPDIYQRYPYKTTYKRYNRYLL